MCEYGFNENSDFRAITQKRVTAQGNTTTSIDYEKIIVSVDTQKRVRTYEQVDYEITIDMAKRT